MAFVELETWQAAPQMRAPSPLLPAMPDPVARVFANGRDVHLRRAVATGVSILIHVVLIWFLVHRLGDGLGAGKGRGEGSDALSVIDLMGPLAEESAAARTEMAQIPPTPAVESEVDATVPNELPAPEWTIARMRVERAPTLAQAAPQKPAPVTPGTSGRGTGKFAGGGGSGYDPYAGAAPLRREQSQAPPSVSSPGLGQRLLGLIGLGDTASPLELDSAALEAARLVAMRVVPTARGTAEFVVRVSPTGMVLDAQLKGGNADPRAVAALRAALLGSKLFDVKANIAETKEIRLPVLQLG